ncbi:MAG TPA: hypothetical protein VJ969_09445 [Desulfopila sp.]|nr:hypothetical protein [Desulfopila sp.]
MVYILFFLFLLAGVFVYFLVKIRTFIVRDRASSAELEANLTLLHLEMQKQEKEETQAEKSEVSHQGSTPKWDYPPEKDLVIARVSAGDEAPEGWELAILLHAQAEEYLGTGLYKSLEKRVATLPGIDKCLFKERELLLLRSSSFGQEMVVDLFWREFLHVAEVAQVQGRIGADKAVSSG